MPGRTDRRLRMMAVLVVFVLLGTVATLRLGWWQIIEAPEKAALARQSLRRAAVVWQPRADIVDRNGTVLAQTTSVDMLDAHPNLIPEERNEEVVATLADILGLRTQAERQRYLQAISGEAKFVRLEPAITAEQSIEIQLARDEDLLPGIALTAKQVRSYPRSGGQGSATLASQLLGFVDASGHGMYGVERAYDERLRGETDTPAMVASLADVGGDLGDTFVPQLKLTLHSGLQKQLERELSAARIQNRAKSVSAVILDPYSGAILASASAPSYSANDFAEVFSRSPESLRDRVIMDTFEPGSVMKTFTVTAALAKGVVTPMTRINDQKVLKFGANPAHDGRVRNADKGSKGRLTVKQVIALSRNVATSKIAAKLGSNTQRAARVLYETWESMGIVGPTGVDLAGEQQGFAPDPDAKYWAPIDLANRSFGQGVSVTLMQLAAGYAPVVNGGFRVRPHVVADEEAAQAEPERIIPAKVARQVRDILVHVTGGVSWYAKGSLIPGYLVGGKTGTAQIWDADKGRWKDRYNNSFVGFVGGDEPEVLIAVRIEEPRFRLTNGTMDLKLESYELFRLIAKGAIKRLDIPRSSDPEAGLPLRGTEAARVLTPQRSTRQKPKRPEARQRRAQSSARDARAGAAADGAADAAGA